MLGRCYVFTGSKIKKMRLDNNWTQKDLANKLGLKNDTAIANYESGYSVPKDEIKLKMCELFNCSIDYLMGMSYYKNSIELQSATKNTIAFLEFSNDNTKKIINDIVQELLLSRDILNLDNIEKIIGDKLEEHRSRN